jgi:hypothetical protein
LLRYLTECGYHRKELLLQTEVTDKLVGLANAVKDVDISRRKLVLRDVRATPIVNPASLLCGRCIVNSTSPPSLRRA